MRYEIGDYVSKSLTGICKVENIMHLDMNGIDKNKLFYLLTPVDHRQEKIYVPVDTADANLRKCMTLQEAWELIEHIPEIKAVWIDNEKLREQKYKEAIKTNSPQALVSIIKMIYQRKKHDSCRAKKVLPQMNVIFRWQRIFCIQNWEWH